MLVCHCVLAGTKACENCSQYLAHYGEVAKTWGTRYPSTLPKKKVTKEYDKDGNVIKEITEEI